MTSEPPLSTESTDSTHFPDYPHARARTRKGYPGNLFYLCFLCWALARTTLVNPQGEPEWTP